MSGDLTDWLAEFAKARDAEIGVVIEANDIPLLKSRFYRLKREHPDILGTLAFITSPDRPTEEAWIVKKEHTNAEDS